MARLFKIVNHNELILNDINKLNNPFWAIIFYVLHSMSPRRGSLQMNRWNTPTSRVWACVCTHCQRVSGLTHTYSHPIITHKSSFSCCAVVLQTYPYLHWRKCSFRGTPVTGTPRTQRQVCVCFHQCSACIFTNWLFCYSGQPVWVRGSMSYVYVVSGTDTRGHWS